VLALPFRSGIDYAKRFAMAYFANPTELPTKPIKGAVWA
jgi:hypothetical protein